ncbi:MAG: phosphate ABC transporter permease PstA [Acidimicrobiales bacterium]
MALTTPAQSATIAPDIVRAHLEGRRTDIAGLAFRAAMLASLAFSVLVLGVLLVDVLTDGWSVLSTRLGSFLTGTLRSQPGEAGVFQGLRGTFWIGIFVMVIAFPLGVGAAIYLEEYARGGRLTNFINLNIRNLAGVPSIVYGILGFAIFVKTFGGVTGGRTVISGGITLAVLVLPIVIITAAEAIRAVPSGLREAAVGVGATRWEMVRDHVLPYAAPGILTGTVLSLARALGEAAPLILVGAVSTGRLGSNPGLFDLGSLDQRFTAMPNVITGWAGQSLPGFRALTAAAIVVVLVVVLAFNAAAILLRNRFEKKRG